MRKLIKNPTRLHPTFKSDTYYTSFSELPKKAQEILLNTPVEVESSRYTMYEPVAFVRNKIEIDGRYFDAEINLDRVDIKDAGYDYDNDKDSYVDDQGRSVDEDEYSEWFAKELWDLAVLDKNVYHYDVYLTETDEPRPERRMGERLRRNPGKEENLEYYKNLIEEKLDIKNTLKNVGDRLIPNSKLLTKKFIKEKMLDDLFDIHNGDVVFTNRMMSLVGEITDRKVFTGHYFFELRDGSTDQVNFNNYREKITEEDVDQLVALLCHGCRTPTYTKIRSALTYGIFRLPRHGIFDRIVKKDGKWSYIAGQSYTDEIRNIRELMIK